ncbi:hypothetical protein SDC9_124135 [bioreactor metagenome]|uniref:Uncharacterized protein n=1 Tax=bioreactor metagenome TaxID=1076179 RepID=A0A645CJL4_9ZZZZ
MPRRFARHAAVAAADDQNPAGLGVDEKRRMSHHLLIGELIEFRQLNDAVEHQHATEFAGLENFDLLEFAAVFIELGGDFNGVAVAAAGFADPEGLSVRRHHDSYRVRGYCRSAT